MAKDFSLFLSGALMLFAACQRAGMGETGPVGPTMPLGAYLSETTRSVFRPALDPGVTFDLSMTGRLWLENDEDGPFACSSAELVFRPRGRDLDHVDLWPGFRHLGVEPLTGFEEWALGLDHIDSDRPLTTTLGAWHTRLTPAQPVRPGESWRVSMRFCDPVDTLAPGMQLDEIIEMAGLTPAAFRATVGAEMVALFEALVTRFTATATSSSFVMDGFFVLLPVWPAPYACPSSGAFHPLDCVARRNLPVSIDIEVPEGWQAILPSPGRRSLDGDLRVDRPPHLLVLAEHLSERTIDVPALDGSPRAVTLCAPDAYREALPELERRVSEALPALERRLGPRPGGALAVCLSPLPVELAGLSAGQLALVTLSSFSQAPSADLSEETAAKLRRWVETDPFFLSDRQSTTIHELAHHYWRVELPEAWDRLLSEGVAMFVSREIQRELDPPPEVLFYAERDPWMGCAQMEFAREELPTLEQFLRLDGWISLPAGNLAPYLLGLRLMESVFGSADATSRWAALARLHAWPEAAHSSAAAIFLVDPITGARFAEAAREAAPVACGDRVDLVAYARRMGQGFLRLALDSSDLPGGVSGDRLLGSLSDNLVTGFLQRYLESSGPAEVLDDVILGIAEVPSCEDGDDACRAEEDEARRRALGVWLALDSGVLEKNDADSPVPAARDLVARAKVLVNKPVVVDDGELRPDAGHSPGELRVEILVNRLISRWAANATLILDAAGRLETSGVIHQKILSTIKLKGVDQLFQAGKLAPEAP